MTDYLIDPTIEIVQDALDTAYWTGEPVPDYAAHIHLQTHLDDDTLYTVTHYMDAWLWSREQVVDLLAEYGVYIEDGDDDMKNDLSEV